MNSARNGAQANRGQESGADTTIQRLWPIRSLKTSIVLLCGVFIVLMTALTVYGVMLTRQHALDQAMGSVEGLAATFAAYTEKAVDEIDFSLLLVRDYARQTGAVDTRLARAVGPVLDLRRRHSPYVSGVVFTNASGRVVGATKANAAAIGTSTPVTREFFLVHREKADAGLHLGPILTSTVYPDQPRFTLSRRIDGPRGELLGVVVAFVDPVQLAQDYARQLGDVSLSVTLMRIDGMVLSRTPFVRDQVGQVLASFARYKGDPPRRNSFVAKSQIDSVTRLIAQRRFDHLPMLIAVTQLHDVALRRWMSTLPLVAGVWLLLVVTTAGLGAVVLHQQGRRERAQAELRESLEVFNEAQRMARVGSIDHDLLTGAQRWSDQMFKLIEVDPAGRKGEARWRDELIHPEDRVRVEHSRGQAEALRMPYMVSYRLQMPDGRIKWISESGVYRFDSAGRPQRQIILLQDVTVAREAEVALLRLRTEMSAGGKART